MSIITIEEILKRKSEIEKRRNSKEKIKIRLENIGEMIFSICTKEELKDILKSDTADKDAELIYNTCEQPNLNNEKLIIELGCENNPEAIVSKFLLPEEINKIAEIILKESGLSGTKVELVKEIKN